jgi:hypothetical protein
MMKYLTDADYEIARENGVNHASAYNRFYVLGWSREDTITIPVADRRGVYYKHGYDEWKETCKENDISPRLYRVRVQRGWSREKAASTPKIDPAETIKKNHRYRNRVNELESKSG